MRDSQIAQGPQSPVAAARPHADSAAESEVALMERNGITRVPAFHYHVDGYRYTSLADALAQVRRGVRGRELDR